VIRPTLPAETEILVELTDATGLFKPIEVQALREVFADYFAFNQKHGHVSITCEEDGQVLGFAYYAQAAMTDRTWYLYWIAVRKSVQARGTGSRLLKHLEDDIGVNHQGRVLFVETGSLPHYQLTRRFYLKNGYEQHALLKDYYAAGDSMVVFRKELASCAAASRAR
jgi:ribosomal protein S18 acetylase RimI-like enzyme